MRSKESKVLKRVKKELLAEHLRMSPEERLTAMAEHSKWILYLADAGKEYRQKMREKAKDLSPTKEADKNL
jgi:hypothetical protein